MKQKNTYPIVKATDSVDSLWVRIDQIDNEISEFIERKREEKQAIYVAIKQKANAPKDGQQSNPNNTNTSHYTKRKFGTLDCDVDRLYTLMTVDYKVIRPMEIDDFKLVFSGMSDPKNRVVCLNVSLFINILFWIQSKGWLPIGTLNTVVYEQCLNRDGMKIKPHNIESEFSKSRNHEIHPKTEEIIKKLRPH